MSQLLEEPDCIRYRPVYPVRRDHELFERGEVADRRRYGANDAPSPRIIFDNKLHTALLIGEAREVLHAVLKSRSS